MLRHFASTELQPDADELLPEKPQVFLYCSSYCLRDIFGHKLKYFTDSRPSLM